MRVRKILKSEQGNAATIMFLILLPVLIIFLMAAIDHSRVILGTDLDLQQALNDACRSGTLMVDPLAQAYNRPIINPDLAHKAFLEILADNLKLNNDLSPMEGTPIKDVSYTFIIFNGDTSYLPEHLPEGMLYSSDDPGGTEFFGDLPYTFSQTEMGIDVQTNMDSPGCIGVITVTLEPILGREETIATRWSAAKILN